ncbi:retrovirus-related pol polyprotein from transposon TNT 1-94 [Tanacetum coccineum]
MKCPQHYLTDTQEVILFYNGLDVPTRQILDSKGAIPSKTVIDAKIAIKEMVEYSQKWHNGTSSRTKGTETSDGLAAIQVQLNNLGREIKKVNEKVYAAQVGCEQCKGPHYTKDCPQKEEGKILEEAYYTQFAKRHEENSNIIKEIRASTDAVIQNQGASIKTLELQIGQISKVLQERGFRSLPGSTETNPKDQVKSISTSTADLSEIRRMKHYPYAVSGPQHRFVFPETVPFPRRLHNYCCEDLKEAHGINILNDSTLPRKEKDPERFTLPCLINNICFDKALVDLGASVSVMPLSTYTNLGLGDLSHTRMIIKLADKTIKQLKGIATNVLVRIGKFVFPIDFVILDIPEDGDIPLILGRPFLSTAHVKIDVYKRKVTLSVGEEKLAVHTAYWRVVDTPDRDLINTRSCDELALIRHIFFAGYGACQGYTSPPLKLRSDKSKVIMESLVKKKQKDAILELKRRHLKKVSICINTPYPSRKIRRISAISSQERVLINSQSGVSTTLQYTVCTAVHQSKIRIYYD